jgi:predicted amidohydrolase YtcJ
LSDNLLTMNPAGIRDVEVLKTMVGGAFVYESK